MSLSPPASLTYAEIMQRGGKDAIGHHQIDRIGGVCHQAGEALGEFECSAKLPIVELIDAQAPESALLEAPVVEAFRKLQCGCPGRAGLSGPTETVHQRPSKRRGELHARARGCHLVSVEAS